MIQRYNRFRTQALIERRSRDGPDVGRGVAAPAGATPRPRTGPGDLPERPAASRHGPIAQLLIALSPLSLILIAYAVAEWINAPLGAGAIGAGTNRLGFGLHVAGPAQVDRGVFGAVPSVWLQERLVDGSAHWYDAVAALVYGTHFVSIPLVTGVVWFCLRDRFAAWIAAVLTFTTLGVGGYVVYPAAPPWLASDRGEIGAVDRISSARLGLPAPGRGREADVARPAGEQPGGGDAVTARGVRAAGRAASSGRW